MKAIIGNVNYQLGRAVFQREDGTYGWLEILDTTELSPEDIVLGNFFDLGGTTIRKDTGEHIDVFIQDFCSLQLAYKMVMYPER